MRQLQCYLRFLALLAYASVMLAGLDEHELCLGRDGHVAIELSGHRCCTACPDHGSGDAHNALWTAGSGNCGDCVDIPLSFAAADHHASHGHRALPTLQAASGKAQGASAPALVSEYWTLDTRSLPPARAVPDLSLRTTVLQV